jgi:long-subunit fatty acid transport protein
VVSVSGSVEQIDRYRDLSGWNGTFGLLWTANRRLVLSFAADLGWTAEGTQARTVIRREQVVDGAGKILRSSRDQTVTDVREVDLEFPLFWTTGAVLRWTPELYTSLDVTRTAWSDFAYDIQGVGRINPFDGTPHGLNPVQDTWAARMGTEYLWITRHADIPFRVGFMYEERPAIGAPDPYLGFSAGSGLAFGKEGRRWIFDVAYQYLTADGVRTVVPEEEAVSTNTEQHLFYISLIKHL